MFEICKFDHCICWYDVCLYFILTRTYHFLYFFFQVVPADLPGIGPRTADCWAKSVFGDQGAGLLRLTWVRGINSIQNISHNTQSPASKYLTIHIQDPLQSVLPNPVRWLFFNLLRRHSEFLCEIVWGHFFHLLQHRWKFCGIFIS